MTHLFDPSMIERIVGRPRHATEHWGRVVSAEKIVYILHSQRCLDQTADLRNCAFSIALDDGISWGLEQFPDQPVRLAYLYEGLTLGCWCGSSVGFRDSGNDPALRCLAHHDHIWGAH